MLRDPKRIYLCPPARRTLVCEVIERESRLSAVLSLIKQHGLVVAADRSCAVIGKRSDGSTVGKVQLSVHNTVEQVEQALSHALVRIGSFLLS